MTAECKKTYHLFSETLRFFQLWMHISEYMNFLIRSLHPRKLKSHESVLCAQLSGQDRFIFGDLAFASPPLCSMYLDGLFFLFFFLPTLFLWLTSCVDWVQQYSSFLATIGPESNKSLPHIPSKMDRERCIPGRPCDGDRGDLGYIHARSGGRTSRVRTSNRPNIQKRQRSMSENPCMFLYSIRLADHNPCPTCIFGQRQVRQWGTEQWPGSLSWL